jgi:hypothetical protein
VLKGVNRTKIETTKTRRADMTAKVSMGLLGEKVLDLSTTSGADYFTAEAGPPRFVDQQSAVLIARAKGDMEAVKRALDPLVLPQPYVAPPDFTAQYPQPLDTQEIIAMCEELSVWQMLPVIPTALNGETWRELNTLAFTTGSSLIAFATGECPEEYTHNGANTTITNKNIGAKKSLSVRDILHSSAVAAASWNGINSLLGGIPSGEGFPGGSDTASFAVQAVADLKEKESRIAMTLVLNGWDRLLVLGDAGARPLEFTGIERWDEVLSCTFNANDNTASGTFSAQGYDRFLAESCAKPTVITGHGAAIQEMLSAYFQLGFAGSQLIEFADGGRITPGFNFAGFVNTGVGRLPVVADRNFTRTNIGGGAFQSVLFSLRMTHNGVPLVYKMVQIPLSMQDLTPGCTAVSFEVWAATALVIKHCCAHGEYTSQFTGRIVTTCPVIG